AAYLALVTPPAPLGADYSLQQLFIQTRSLDALPGWTPSVEVYHGTAPLLQPGAPPLSRLVLDRLRGQSGASWGRGVALAPLFDRDRWEGGGAVAIRPAGVAPGWLGGWSPPRLALVAASALGGPRAGARGGERRRARRAGVRARLSSRRWVELRTAPAEAGAPPWLALLLALALIGPLAAWVAVWVEREAARPQRLRETAAAWWFLAPATLNLAVFSFDPILLAVYASVHRWSLVEPARPFVGLANVAQPVRDPVVWISLRNTALYTLTVPVTMVVALGAALALGRRSWGARLARTAVCLPFASSVVAVALVWQWMYHPDSGALTWMLSLAVVGPVDWLGNPNTALIALMIVSLWVQAGYQMTVFLAGLQAIPRDYLDAARVDGAGR